MGLLDQVLGAVLTQGDRNRSTGGGIGDLLSGLAGGGQDHGGANLLMSLLPAVVAMLSQRGAGGGLGGLLQQFQAAGLGQQADSWVGTGPNLTIGRDEIENALGRERIAQIAAQAGVSHEHASGGLAALLPELVNQLTPQGEVPPPGQLDDSLASLKHSLGL